MDGVNGVGVVDPDPVSVAIALGSNLGDRERYLRNAIDELCGSIAGLKASSFYDTDPVGVGDQPRFLNAAVTGLTALPARALLETLLGIEAKAGRTRPHPGAARTLDLDLILYGDRMIEAGRCGGMAGRTSASLYLAIRLYLARCG